MSEPDTDVAAVAAELRACALSWEPGVRLLGNVRAADVLRVLDRLAEAERDRGVMIGQYAALRVEMMGVERERDEARGLLREAYPWLRNFRGTDNAGPMLARISTHLESK